jgi:tetratricopeptide (TPR) repeat protein
MGLLHCHQNRNAEALSYAERGLPFLADCPPIEQAYLLSALCWFNGNVGNHRQALAYGQQALAIFDTADDPGFRGNLIEGMAWVNGQLGQHAEAIALYENALQGYRDARLQLAEARTLVLLGETYEAMNKTDTVVETWMRAIPVLDRLDPPAAAALRQRLQQLAPPPA